MALDLSRPWDRIREQAKLPGFRIHDLRHTCASVLAAQGESLIVIGKLLGHTVPATEVEASADGLVWCQQCETSRYAERA